MSWRPAWRARRKDVDGANVNHRRLIGRLLRQWRKDIGGAQVNNGYWRAWLTAGANEPAVLLRGRAGGRSRRQRVLREIDDVW